jgi:hypothetical protein
MRLIAVEETIQHIDGWNVAFGSEGDTERGTCTGGGTSSTTVVSRVRMGQ